MERGTSGTVFAIRRKIIKINKKMGARVYAHARKGFIGTLVPHISEKSIKSPWNKGFGLEREKRNEAKKYARELY